MRSISVTLIISLFSLMGVGQRPTSITTANPPQLFRILEVKNNLAEADRSSIASAREAVVEFSRGSADLMTASRLEVPLFDDRSIRFDRVEREVRSLDDLTWRGAAKGDAQITVTHRNGLFGALITTPERNYEVVSNASGHVLIELDSTRYPRCADEVVGDPAEGSRVSNASPDASMDSGDRIDVLVLYTAAVRTSVGGDAQAQLLAQQSIDSSNTTYLNSGIRLRVRLVGAQLTTLTETGDFNTELTNLRSHAPTATIRNEVRADLVAMLTNSTAACGIGYLMGAQGGNPNNGFTVTARTCSVGNLTFAHELGHNMGSTHNPENGSSATYPYGYGHYHNGQYRTVMSYVNPCTSGCPKGPHFSNPDVLYAGLPTGIANARDNARSINNTADWIANYRYSGSSIVLSNNNGGGILRRMSSANLRWVSDGIPGNVRIDLSRDGSRTWETVVASTPNDGEENIRITGKPTSRARIRVVSLNTPHVSDSSVTNVRLQ